MDLSSLMFRDRITDVLQLDQFWRSLFIAGIEVTQAVQHYKAAQHLTDPDDQGPDNSLRLIANKPAWVRVYASSLFGLSNIDGTLEVQRRHSGLFWSTVATLSPSPPLASAVPGAFQADYATIRGTLNNTLNFIIPADTMIGNLRLIARVTSGSRSAEFSVNLEVTRRQTLRLAGVMIEYNGPASMAANAPNLTIAAPTLADLQNMSGRTLTLFPVQSTAQFRTAGTITLTYHLQDTAFPASGCGAGWNALHGEVVNARTADGNQAGWIYYGLLPAGVPMGPVGGCGGGGVAVGPVNQPGTLAHEAGHACGLGHAPAGGAPNPDGNYPAYEPYDPANTPQGSVGEYGLNTNNGNIANPNTFRDFMAYGGPSWISPYHHGRLVDNDRLNPVTVGVDYPWWKDLVWEEYRKWPWIPLPDPPPFPFDLELPMYPPAWQQQRVISLIVRVERDTVAEVMHVARTSMNTEMDRASPTRFTAQLRGKGGKVLAEAPLLRLETASSGCKCSGGGDPVPTSYIAQALISDVAPGAELAIDDGKEVVWSRQAPAKPVRVEGFEAKLDRKGDLVLEWSASEGAVEYWLRWSTDGENWRALVTGLEETKARVDARRLPGGKVRLQVVAHDGFHSTASKPVTLELPDRPPEVAILHPVDGHTYVAGQSLRLWGSVSHVDDSRESPPRAVWRLGRKTIAEGTDTWITLEPGRHKLTFQVEDEGGTAQTSVTVTVVRLEEPQEEKPTD